MSRKKCSECWRGEIEYGPVEAKVSHPNDEYPNLRTTKLVCEDHFGMLADDYGDDLKMIESFEVTEADWEAVLGTRLAEVEGR